MRDKEAVVARNIGAIIARKKMIAGSRVDVLIELRDEGVLGAFDLGVGTVRRDRPDVNLQKFMLINTCLTRAVNEGIVLLDDDGFSITLGAPHRRPAKQHRFTEPLSLEPWVPSMNEQDIEDQLPPLSTSMLMRLRTWGWGELDERVS